MKTQWRCAFLWPAFCLVLATCNRPPLTGVAKMTFTVGARANPTSTPSTFSCYGVMVTGWGIQSKDAPTDGSVEQAEDPPATYCTYPGASSVFVPLAANGLAEIDLLAPKGFKRLIQVLALDTRGQPCPSVHVSEFLIASRQQAAVTAPYGGLYEVGRAVADIDYEKKVSITSSYNPATAKNLRTCVGPNENPDLALNASSLSLLAGDNFTFNVSGGVGLPAAFTYTRGSVAGETFVSGTGVFTAGTADSYLQVTDTVGNWVKVPITYFNPATLGVAPTIWYRAQSYWPATDGWSIVSNWSNGGTSATPNNLIPQTVGGYPKFRRAGANGNPSVEFNGGSYFANSGSGSTTMDVLHVFMVSSRTNGNQGSLLCLGTGGCGPTYYFELGFSNIGNPGVFAKYKDGSSFLSTSNVDDAGWAYTEVVSLAASSSISLTINGIQDLASGAALSNFSTDTVQLGNGSATFDGQIAEFVLYDGASGATSLEFTTVRNYLTAKYGL